ncbi:hypothetical protein Lalb_Chr21g0312901 [Lupinus albus]|uniref:Uncharacterized protein n=1 Tax=Lupinus albus TaxID=3870 RepID=A0A6A4NCW8_LUPAL|nr:hypothetical protein Lalb_Chr21g0312901 [Lupinus albus]
MFNLCFNSITGWSGSYWSSDVRYINTHKSDICWEGQSHKRLIPYPWHEKILLVVPKKTYLCNRLELVQGSGMTYSHVSPSFSLLLSPLNVFLSIVVFFMLVSAAPTSLTLKSVPNHGMELTQLREMDMQRHGRMLQSILIKLPVDGATQVGFIVG